MVITRTSTVATLLAIGACATVQTPIAATDQATGARFAASAGENRPGAGPMRVAIDGKTYVGRWARTSRGAREPLFGQKWNAWRVWDPTGPLTADEHAQSYGDAMALLTTRDGEPLRCILYRTVDSSNAGTCRDAAGHVFDVKF